MPAATEKNKPDGAGKTGPGPGKKGADYHRQPTGRAADTAREHEGEPEGGLTLYGACFCPFVQRAWAALEYCNMPYRYVEVDPYAKPKELLDVNPRGLVPALRLPGNKCLGESSVIVEYIQDVLSPSKEHPSLFISPEDAFAKAKQRLAVDHINRKIVPAFYRYLQAQEPEKQIEGAKEYLSMLESFTKDMDPNGPFFAGKELGVVDLSLAPWAFRSTNVLVHYRSFSLPALNERGSRYKRWHDAVLAHPAFQATCSTEDLYLDSYARYAENRPNTSQVADAINSGKGLP